MTALSRRAGERAGVVRRGHVLRIVDLDGQQAVDFLCCNAQDPSERYNAADTMKVAGTIYNPCNGGRPTPIRLVTYEPDGEPAATAASAVTRPGSPARP